MERGKKKYGYSDVEFYRTSIGIETKLPETHAVFGSTIDHDSDPDFKKVTPDDLEKIWEKRLSGYPAPTPPENPYPKVNYRKIEKAEMVPTEEEKKRAEWLAKPLWKRAVIYYSTYVWKLIKALGGK